MRAPGPAAAGLFLPIYKKRATPLQDSALSSYESQPQQNIQTLSDER
ncbi:hypothetical protein N182_32025 [Sinorhizobium sp. GL2]|nr:hypothetical protein N182_32025 [Sinorhizobium sp. GL2]